ncbi:MAG: sensor histidine kinase, partial [Omnitrophica WOR_2 bacterium]
MAKLLDRGSTFNIHPPLPENIGAEEVRSLSPLEVEKIRNLSLLSLGLGFFFSILALVNLLVLPHSISLESALIAVGTAAILMAIQVTCARRVYPAAWVKPGGGVILLLALANALLPLYATLEPRFTIGLMLLFAGAGFWMVSDLGFITLLAGGILGWGICLYLAPTSGDWLYFGFALLSSALLSGVIHTLRLRSAHQFEMLKEQEARFKGEIALASNFADQAAVALENIRLYNEIKRLNQDLEDRVRQRTEALQVAYDQLEKLDRSKSDFISIASHELRTPLTVLQGYTQMLMDEAEIRDDPLHKQLVAGIYSGAVRLHEIVNQFLDAARIDSQALQIHPSPILIANLIDYV